MPSIAAHLVCAKLVAENLNIDDENFFQGNVLPDIINLSDSHSHIRGSYYLIPDIQKFLKKKKTGYLYLGYLCHLLLDRYFLEEYIPQEIENYKEVNIFSKDLIYEDYTNINYFLVKRFDLDLNYINKILANFEIELNEEKYRKNILWINTGKNCKKLKVLKEKDFSLFLENVAEKISGDINRFIEWRR